MGKIVAITAVVLLLIIIGFTVFDIGDGDLAREGNATTTDVANVDLDLNGIGGPEEGVTGFEDFESEREGGDFVPKG